MMAIRLLFFCHYKDIVRNKTFVKDVNSIPNKVIPYPFQWAKTTYCKSPIKHHLIICTLLEKGWLTLEINIPIVTTTKKLETKTLPQNKSFAGLKCLKKSGVCRLGPKTDFLLNFTGQETG